MFSLDKFYSVLYYHLLKPCDISYDYFTFGQISIDHLHSSDYEHPISRPADITHKKITCYKNDYARYGNHTFFLDQEPLSQVYIDICVNGLLFLKPPTPFGGTRFKRHHQILANSEISEIKDALVKDFLFLDWYYFSHGFIALDWYRDYRYLLIDKSSCFSKVFIMYNNLITKNRSYRLGIVADLLDRGLRDQGLISMPLEDKNGSYVKEVFDPKSFLSKEHKRQILITFKSLSGPLLIDSEEVDGTFSARINLGDNQKAFWHIVSETNFYQSKLHLTEKIFKPIISYRPFVLAGYAGNLRYLRSYGFKTFGDFIDESYDLETDSTQRMRMIVDEVEKLCQLTPAQQKEMFEAMRPILEHNYNHFYGSFKKIIVDEMVYGFGECVNGWIDDSAIDYPAVAAKLAQ